MARSEERRRAVIDALKAIPARHRAWLNEPVGIRGFELFCYNGWGVVPNDAQISAINDIFERETPEEVGTFHLWRWANRTGKTTGLLLLHKYIAFKKWRYENADLDGWLGYRYKTLHSAPEGILMGKAWELADSLIDGSAIVQRSPITNRQRPGIFVGSPMFRAVTLRDASAGGDQPAILVANGARVDFLQTYSGAGRMESDAWWFIVWDEFGEHKPVDRVPYLVDSTFLPRSSDFMAPVVLSSTEKEHNAAVYMELEDLAARDPDRWNIREFGREANFSQSKASMERQVRMSSDTATAQRSVKGGTAESSAGSVLPRFTLERAYNPELPAHRTVDDLPPPPTGRTWKVIQSFDHAIKGDRIVLLTVAVLWPILGPNDLIHHRVRGLDLETLSTSRVMTPEEVVAFAVRGHRKHGHPGSIWLTDTTGEGGIMYHRMLRSAGIPSREFNYTARVSKNDRRTKKAHGRTGLQRLFSLGLPLDDQGRIIVPDGDLSAVEFGGIELPLPDPLTGKEWRRMWRQLAMLKADDEKLTQDHAMVALQVAGFLYPYFERRSSVSMIDANPFGQRIQRVRGIAITR